VEAVDGKKLYHVGKEPQVSIFLLLVQSFCSVIVFITSTTIKLNKTKNSHGISYPFFSLLLLLLGPYFSIKRGCPMVLKFSMGFKTVRPHPPFNLVILARNIKKSDFSTRSRLVRILKFYIAHDY
jgi:hypothetical protein